MAEAIAQGVPEAFWRFLDEACRVPADVFRWVPAEEVQEPARSLLVHQRDMTSTLAAFHDSEIAVDVIRRTQSSELYLREVFLRARATNRIVEYGVIAIALERFTPEQREAVLAGRIPLGGLLHRFQIPFESNPIGYVTVAARQLPESLQAALPDARCFGRINRLTTPAGEPLAWILEVLPP